MTTNLTSLNEGYPDAAWVAEVKRHLTNDMEHMAFDIYCNSVPEQLSELQSQAVQGLIAAHPHLFETSDTDSVSISGRGTISSIHSPTAIMGLRSVNGSLARSIWNHGPRSTTSTPTAPVPHGAASASFPVHLPSTPPLPPVPSSSSSYYQEQPGPRAPSLGMLGNRLGPRSTVSTPTPGGITRRGAQPAPLRLRHDEQGRMWQTHIPRQHRPEHQQPQQSQPQQPQSQSQPQQQYQQQQQPDEGDDVQTAMLQLQSLALALLHADDRDETRSQAQAIAEVDPSMVQRAIESHYNRMNDLRRTWKDTMRHVITIETEYRREERRLEALIEGAAVLMRLTGEQVQDEEVEQGEDEDDNLE